MSRYPHELTPPRLLLGISISLVAYLFFVSVSSVVWRAEEEITISQILFFQNSISLLCILPFALRKGISKLKTNYLGQHLMRDLFGVGSYFFYFLAIRNWDLVNATTLNYTAPFFVPIIWWIWTKQKVGSNVWWSIIAGFFGVATILNPSRTTLELGFIYGIFAGISSGISFCALRILNLHREPMEKILFYYFTVGTLLSFPFAWVSWVTPSDTAWLELLWIGFGTAIAQVLLTIAYRFGTASYLSPIGYSTIIYAGLISWLFFNEPFPPRSILGTLLIVFGGTITYILKKKPETLAETFKNPDAK